MSKLLAKLDPNLPNGNRTKPTVKQLKGYIDTELDWVTAAKKDFTAYTITLLIRAKYPLLEIVHEDVRHYVHNKMQKYNQWSKLAWGYDSQIQNYNGEDATTYSPMLQTVIGSVSNSTVAAQNTVTVTKESAPKPQPIKALPAPNQIHIDWGED